jgi:hypothetical protein
MTPEEREAIYDAEIAPALLKLAARCEECGMSFVAEVEWNPAESAGGRTVTLAEGSSFAVRLVEIAARVQGNVDALIIALQKYARTHGNNSMFLRVLEKQ